MVDCEIPLSIIFIGSDKKVISVKEGVPNSEEYISEDNAQYVLEVNPTKDIKIGDELFLEDSEEKENTELEPDKLYILGSDGTPQAVLQGSERIFSIKNTKTLVSMAKRAYESKSDADYKALGRKVFEYIKQQNERPEEYVEE